MNLPTEDEIERIMCMSDAELLAEYTPKELGALVTRMRGIFERARLMVDRAGIVVFEGTRYALTWDEGI